jgi:hypothetical protein
MDITRDEADSMLGILRNDTGEFATGDIMYWPSWPISDSRKLMLEAYVKRHEKDAYFKNTNGQPFLYVNKHLVNLREGAGFGELALMSSNVKRMASVLTSTIPCVLATLSKKDFQSVIKRAQKRKMMS